MRQKRKSEQASAAQRLGLCTALLLNYKNRTWPDIDPFAAFTLDLL